MAVATDMDHLDLEALPPKTRYKLLTAIVIPRPVAWITTVGHEGVVNAAPYSFFNLFGEDPATVVLGLEHRADGSPKDTTRNIAATGEFVVNIVTPSLLDAMINSASAYDAGISEPAALGLPLAPSIKVAPPRLADAPAAIECRRLMNLSFGPTREILIGEAIGLAGRPGLIDTEHHHVDWQDEWPLARLFADRYASLVELPRRSIPPVPVSSGSSAAAPGSATAPRPAIPDTRS